MGEGVEGARLQGSMLNGDFGAARSFPGFGLGMGISARAVLRKRTVGAWRAWRIDEVQRGNDQGLSVVSHISLLKR